MTQFSVRQVNTLIQQQLTGDPRLRSIAVRGEITNLRYHSSGHIYFTLFDDNSKLDCKVWKRNASALRVRLQNGMKVIAAGSINTYVEDGRYYLNGTYVMPEGVGEKELALRRLYEKLDREGLFDPRHKKPLPVFPKRIGVVTSANGKVIGDIRMTVERRYPLAEIILIPARVQGEGAAASIAEGIRTADRLRLADVLIVGRGGGEELDLSAFNDEALARTIYACRIPVISAVGHGPDVAVIDSVADLHAATPTAAAEAATPDRNELYNYLQMLGQQMTDRMLARVTAGRRDLAVYAANRLLQDPTLYLQEQAGRLAQLSERLSEAGGRILQQKKQECVRLAAALDALSPLKVLRRGYSLVRNAEGEIISSVSRISPGQRLFLSLSDGSANVTVDHVEEDVT